MRHANVDGKLFYLYHYVATCACVCEKSKGNFNLLPGTRTPDGQTKLKKMSSTCTVGLWN